jgi:hypothetical protein
MGLIEFIKKIFRFIAKTNDKVPLVTTNDDKPTIVDRTDQKGKGFEFLFDNIMTPNSYEWTKTTKNDWHYYQVGLDEYSYSVEESGIQMTFNKEIHFDKAKKIGDEIIANINATGQKAELITLDHKKVYRFD